MTLNCACLLILRLEASEIQGRARGSAKSAIESKRNQTPTQIQTQDGLPLCVNDPERIGQIEDSLKKDPATKRNKPTKYKATAEALASQTDEELMARLIYAETRAARCPEHESAVSDAIARVVKNRIAKRAERVKDPVKSVVFEIDQFASSLNNYAGSEWREFLCPSDSKLWRRALELANLPHEREQAAKISASNLSNIPADAFNYYLYKHSDRFQPPAWARGQAVSFNGSAQISDCLRLFRLPYK